MIDLVVKDARVIDGVGTRLVDIEIEQGIITAIGASTSLDAQAIDAEGRLLISGFVDSHLHLDKSRLMTLGGDQAGTLTEAMASTRQLKSTFTVEDVYTRAEQTLRNCIMQGTTKIRTQVEVDPIVRLRGLEGIIELAHDYSWAVDIEICVFPQDGLSGAEDLALLANALEKGAVVVGGAPYADRDPVRQVDEIFALAKAFDVDIDFHLDLAEGPEGMLLEYVCQKTQNFGYEGRVAVGHVTQLSYVTPDRYEHVCDVVAAAGVAVTVLPSTDLFLMGREATHAKPRGVLSLGALLARGVDCSLATNNVLNAFTPYGDGSLLRMANMYANTCHVSSSVGLAECFGLITDKAARVIGDEDYGIAIGKPADLVLLDTESPSSAVAEITEPLWGMKAGKPTFTRARPQFHDPGVLL